MAIRHKRKNSANYTWQSSDLVEGQIGLNIADGTLHFKKADNSVVKLDPNAATGATTLDGLSDVVLGTPAAGEVLYYNGTNWVDTALSGLTAGTATVASTVTLTADNSTNATNYPLFVNSTTGNLSPRTDSGFTYNPSTNTLFASIFQGTHSGPHEGTVGASVPNTGAFTTLSASSTVSGSGFSTYLASPPAIGGTAAAAGSFTTLSASSTVSGTGFSNYLASPPAIGGTAAAAGSFTTLSASTSASLKAINEGAIFSLGTTGGTIAPNVANGNVQSITLNSALTINAFTSPVAGQTLTLIINGGTAYTSITSTMKFAGGIKTLTATAGCVDILTVYYDGTNYWASLGKDFK